MTGLDTNILVRFFAQDDPMQSPKAGAIIASLTPEKPGWVGVITLLELVWVITSKNRSDRRMITKIVSQLLAMPEIVIERTHIIEQSLQQYQDGNADFADCLIACSARVAGCEKTVTFDRTAARDTGMTLIS